MSGNENLNRDDLQQAERVGGEKKFEKIHRTIPTKEGTWRRGGHLVRIKLIDIEPALPTDFPLGDVAGLAVCCHTSDGWVRIPHQLDYCDGYGRWDTAGKVTPNTQLCFFAPGDGAAARDEWPQGSAFDGSIELMLWDSRDRARLEGVRIYYSKKEKDAEGGSSPLRFETTEAGVSVIRDGKKLLGFARDKGYQIDFAAPPGGEGNLVEEGRVWRWLLTETPAELTGEADDDVTFEPVVTEGIVLVAKIAATSRAGKMTATLRIFTQAGALVLEFADYRAVRAREELPPEKHERSYAGQIASPFPNVHYAAFVLDAKADDAKVFDHLYKYGPVDVGDKLELVYTGERDHKGFNWMALAIGDAAVGITAHGRSHHPDHPFKAGVEAGRTVLALEPFGSEVNGHYHSCDRYMLVLAPEVAAVREVFETLDTHPILAKVPVRRDLAFLETYEALSKWINLNLDYLMKPGRYRNALRTDGTFRDDEPTPMVAIGEMIRLYEKTGDPQLLETAEKAAEFAADWVLDGKFYTRGKGINPNGGGIYQNEQIYLLLSIARVYANTKNPKLLEAVEFGVRWLYDRRGGKGTWVWENYLWHAGAFDAEGNALYYWPVNTNQFATLNFRLYQLLGDKKFYDYAMEVMTDYLEHMEKDSSEATRGGGVSDTTRGVHLFAEAIEVAGDDPRIDVDFWRDLIERTQDRFWIEGWLVVRHSMYAEVIRGGDDAGELFSPGFSHWHNMGQFLDIGPRIQIAAEVGVSEHLTRWSVRDLALEFDVRYGIEEHVHFGRYTIRDTDIEPASWLDPELLPMLWAVARRGWIEEDEFQLMHYKIHRMVQRTFIPFDETHGGWANNYDAHEGKPIKYLAYWEERHSHEHFAPGEPLEMWGVATREAYHDHCTHYWSHLEQLVDELLVAETVSCKDGVQEIRCREDGLAAGLPGLKPVLIAKAQGAERVELAPGEDAPAWRVCESRCVVVGGRDFWLLAVEAT